MTVKQTLKVIAKPDKSIFELPDEFHDLFFDSGKTAFNTKREPLLDELQYYPPELPNQRYVRTYRLRNGWTVTIKRLSKSKFMIEVKNDTDYATDVMGSLALSPSEAGRFQHDIHKGRWQLTTVVLQEQYTEFLQELNDVLTDALKDYGAVLNFNRQFEFQVGSS